jgi:hypothetical protein
MGKRIQEQTKVLVSSAQSCLRRERSPTLFSGDDERDASPILEVFGCRYLEGKEAYLSLKMEISNNISPFFLCQNCA